MNTRDEYRQVQEKVIGLLESSRPIVKDIYQEGPGDGSATSRHEDVLSARIKTLHNSEFVVVVLGEFNRGKSTLLNALLGHEIFATDVTEATAAVGFMKANGTSPPEHQDKAVVYFRDDRPPEVVEHHQLADYTTRQSVHGPDTVATTIDYAEIFVDSEFVKDGVTLVDTPGINTVHSEHLRITYEQIDKSHAALFLLNANAAFNRVDKDFLTEIRKKIERFFFLVNRIDETAATDRPRVLQHVRKNLADVLGREVADRAAIHGISGLQALLGRHGYVDPNPIVPADRRDELDDEYRRQLVDDSGIEPFEESLLSYLFKGEKTRDLLASPLSYVHDLLDRCKRYVDEQTAVLEGSLEIEELDSRQTELERQIADHKSELDKTSQTLLQKLDQAVDEAVEEIRLDLDKAEEVVEDTLAGYLSIEEILGNWEEGGNLSTLSAKTLERALVNSDRLLTQRIRSVLQAEDRRLRGRLREVVEGVAHFKLPELPSFDIAFEPATVVQDSSELDSVEAEIEELEEQMYDIENSLVPDAGGELDRLRRERDALSQRALMEKQGLGARPAIQRYEYQEEELQYRGGLWGVLKYALAGRDRVMVQKFKMNDSDQVHYDAKLKAIESTVANAEKEIEAKIRKQESTWTEAQKRERAAEAKKRLKEKKEEKLHKLQKAHRERVRKSKEQALRQAKRSLKNHFEELKTSLLRQLESMVDRNRDIVTSFVENMTEEIDEVMQQLIGELAHLKDLKAKKGDERDATLSRLQGQRSAVEKLLKTSDDLRMELMLAFPSAIEADEGSHHAN